jgi:hypothetical protein
VSLSNIDGPISASIDVVHEDRHSNSSIVRISSGDNINASVSLSNVGARHRPALDLVAVSRSSNSSNIRISTAPLDSLISAHVSSSGGPALLSLPPSYEGDFILRAPRTELQHLHLRHGEVDPSGRGRNRTERHHEEDADAIAGRIWWGEPDDSSRIGFVQVIGAPATLEL